MPTPTPPDVRYATSPAELAAMSTAQLRETFLIPEVMVPGEVRLTYTHYDRFIAGGAVPTDRPLSLEAIAPLKADFFLERRELGAINVGGAGTVTVDGEPHAVGNREAIYVGRGSREVTFASDSPEEPARFYLNSAPAHAAYPTRTVSRCGTRARCERCSLPFEALEPGAFEPARSARNLAAHPEQSNSKVPLSAPFSFSAVSVEATLWQSR